jgi:ligand-binding sensor domain-containing protein
MRSLIFICWIWATGALFAQEPYFLHYSTQHGLPSSETYALSQDDKGYLWIATDRAAVRYDGQHWNAITTSEGLPNNIVYDFYEDDCGRLWFVNMEHRGLPCYWDGYGVHCPPKQAEQNQLPQLDKVSFAIDCQAQHFILGGRRDKQTAWLQRYDLLTGHFLDSVPAQKLPKGLQAIHGQKVILNNPFLDYGNSLKQELDFQRRSGKTAQFVQDNEHWRHCFVNSRQQMVCVSPASWMLSHGDSLLAFGFTQGKAGNIRLYEDRQGGYWLCTFAGVYHYAQGLEQPPTAHWLQEHIVTDVLEDQEGNLWFSTWDAGIFCHPYTRPLLFQQRHYNSNKVYVLSSIGEQLLLCDAGQNLWLWDSLSQKPRLFASQQDPQRLFLQHFFDGLYWKAKQLFLLDFDVRFSWPDKRFIRQSLHPDLQGNVKRWLLLDSNRLAASTNNGFYIYRHAEHSVFASRFQGFSQRTEALWQDSTGRLWIGSLNGIYTYREGQRIEPADSLYPPAQFRCSDIQPLLGEQYLLFATHGMGLLAYHQGRWQQWTVAQGLISNTIHRLYIQNNQQVWLATDKGLQCLHLYQKSDTLSLIYWQVFNVANGLPSNEIFSLHHWREHLVLATAEGFVFLPWIQLQKKAPSPYLYLSQLKINGLVRGLDLLKPLILKPRENEITVLVNVVGYSHANYRYRYRLVGQDAQYQYSQNPVFHYTNLPPREYELRISVAGSDGVFSAEQILKFEILPHWMDTWWFWLASFVLLILVFYLINWGLIQYNRRKEAHARQLLNLEIKALRAQMNPHFLFNSLNSISYFISQNEKSTALQYLGKFARLLRQVLDNSRQNTLSLEQELDFLRLYIDLEQKRFDKDFQAIFVVDLLPNQLKNLQIPPMLIQPFVENAILHGLMNKEGERQLQLRFFEQGEQLQIWIEDNGIGRAAAEQINQRRSARRGSLGLLNIEERFAQMRVAYAKAFELKIIDLYDEQGQALGTRVCLQIPKLS